MKFRRTLPSPNQLTGYSFKIYFLSIYYNIFNERDLALVLMKFTGQW